MPASSEQSPLLLVSASARALAQSAARSGLPVVVLDLFNDLDVRALAVASRSVAGWIGGLGPTPIPARHLQPVRRTQ